jgi:hypothetical protein
MKLTGMMEALGRFISKLGEKGLPFFKLLKKSDKFEWTDEADQALEELKTFLTMTPIIVPPAPKETLLLYISASTQEYTHIVRDEVEETRSLPSTSMSIKWFHGRTLHVASLLPHAYAPPLVRPSSHRHNFKKKKVFAPPSARG